MFVDHRKAFATLKTAPANATLHHLTENSTLSLTTDASDTAVGATIHEVTQQQPPYCVFPSPTHCRRKKLKHI